jgi:L-methionine (R)-S-oxide reductase
MVYRETKMLLTRDHDRDQETGFATIGKLLSAARTLDEIVGVLRANARQIVGSDGIAVILREGDYCRYAAEDAIEPLWVGQRFPLKECVSGWAMLHDTSVIITDLENDPRVPKIAYARTSMRSLAMVPLGSPRPVAALGAYWCAYVEVEQATLRRMEILARIAFSAMQRVESMGRAETAKV